MVCKSCGSLSGKATRTKTTSKSTRRSNANNFFGNNMSYKWAIPTWHFFHSFAAKIHESFYASHRLDSLNLIRNICRSLPCPHCQQHANAFFKNLRAADYPTKESFRQLLLEFNNDVNRRTKKPLLTRNDLNKYDNSIFFKITELFLQTLNTYRGTMGGGLPDTQSRRAMIHYVKNWVNRYHLYFL